MKNWLTKVVWMNSQYTLKELAAEYELPNYTQGQDAGRFKLAQLSFLKINGLEDLVIEKKYEEAKKLLLLAVGDRYKFEDTFSKNPFSLNRTPYWKGSYVYALMDTFPELKLNIFDFPKLPRYAELIFDSEFTARQGYQTTGIDFVVEQAQLKYGLNAQKAVKFVSIKLGRGVRIFTDRDITGREPKGPYIDRAERILEAQQSFTYRGY